METVRVIYVGKKLIKEDNVAGTGAVWQGEGDVQDVPLAAWPRLAPHTGVWRLVEAAEVTPPTPLAPLTLGDAPVPLPEEAPVEPDEEAPAEQPAEQPAAKPVAEWSVPELKAALATRGIAFRANASQAALVALLEG